MNRKERQWQRGKVATKIRKDSDGTHVRYHHTDVVTIKKDKIVLRHNGWKTVTTKNRMNQVSELYGLGYSTVKKYGDLYVTDKNGDVHEFYNQTLTLQR